MKHLILALLALSSITAVFSQDEPQGPRAFITINGTLGRHSITFKDFDKSPGLSFGFSVSAGIYAVNDGNYRGGLVFTLLEGASRNTSRRQLSEDFELPSPEFDKHIIFNFAQFRSTNIGWFSEYSTSKRVSLYHQIGFGIFGTTEQDQLLDFGMSNQAGVLIGDEDKFRLRLGLNYDNTFGTGNPNYLQNNLGFTLGGYRAI